MKKINGSTFIAFNKSKFVFLLIVSAGFILAGIFIFSFAGRQENAAHGLLHAIGLAAIVFFSATAVYSLKKYFNKKPALLLNSQGLQDNASIIAPQLIKWDDITGFNIAQVKRAKFVLVYVKNAEDYLQNKGFFKKMVIKTNIQMYGTPFSIAASDIKCDLEKLVETIIDAQKKYSNNTAGM